MKILSILNLVVLTLLALASGVVKMRPTPEDLDFFGTVGMDATGIVLFGTAQIVGGLLMMLPRTRVPGATIVLLTFGASAALLFATGTPGFGLLTMLPMLLLVLVIYASRRKPQTTDS